MELLKSSNRRSRVSNMAYVALNIGMAVAQLFIVWAYPEAPWVAVLLAMLGKWRIFAVRPRFWVANVAANLVDFIVSLSTVLLLYAAVGSIALQIAITALFILWLLWVKPSAKRNFVAVQAAIAIFTGVSALMTVAYGLDAFFVVTGMWLIGFSAAKHVLTGHEETHAVFLSLMWGLFFAELGWLAYHWMFVYNLPGFGGIKLVQVAIVALALSFVAERAYDSRQAKGRNNRSDIVLPIIFSVLTVIILVVFFNSIGGVGGLE